MRKLERMLPHLGAPRLLPIASCVTGIPIGGVAHQGGTVGFGTDRTTSALPATISRTTAGNRRRGASPNTNGARKATAAMTSKPSNEGRPCPVLSVQSAPPYEPSK